MAGIGFELKKIFRKNSVIEKLRGSVYAATITVGPMILIIVTLFLMYYFLGYSDILFSSKDLLASTILYVFIFSLCTTAPANAVISRYVADKIYENKEDDILPCYYATLAWNVVASSIIGVVFCVREWWVGGVDALYVFSSFSAYMGLVLVFASMLYITAIKEYKKIAGAFAAGLFIALIIGVVLVKVFGVNTEYSIITAFAIGFIIIAFALFGIVKMYFKENSRNYKGVLSYFKLHWKLFFTNTFYTYGLYVHNFVFWTTKHKIIVSDSFLSAPVYDMATCIAMFINISTMVIFIVEVETDFHDQYQIYCQSLMGGIGEEIQYAKSEMFRSIRNELIFIVEIQIIFTISIFFITILVLPMISVGGLITAILPTLTVGYFALFIMYGMIIFIYYFNVYDMALKTAAIFFFITLIGSILCRALPPSLYGLGFLLGAFSGLTYAYYAIQKIEKNLDYYIFCKGTITPKIIEKEYGQKIYENKLV